MKIISSSIQFKTEYSQRTRDEQRASLSYQQQSTDSNAESTTGTLTRETTQFEQRTRLSSSLNQNVYSATQIRQQGNSKVQQFTTQKSVSAILERFYSQSIRMNQMQLSEGNPMTSVTRQAPASSQMELAIGRYYEVSREQQLAFVAEGQIQTEDGRSINFQFYANANQNFRYQDAAGAYAEKVVQRTDPLIIHLEGDINHLSSASFEFDLNNDGEKETLSFAGNGSGFLALDKNGDGKINNGAELFGSQTGNGFAELNEYDEDGNGFIDEGDSIYEQLSIWQKDADGNDRLISLKEAGVAAIGTQSGLTPFAITDAYNNEYGQARSTGIFIRESGEVGAVQQIDLASRNTEEEAQLALQFDRGEQRAALERENNRGREDAAAELTTLRDAMARLDSETRAMLDRQDDLAKAKDEDGPKSFLAQIVEKLEEVRLAQKARREERENQEKQATKSD